MRRADRERGAEFALEILEKSEYATLSTVSADGEPYGVPVHIVLLNGALYFHCALEGQKLENIAANPNVCVSTVGELRLVPENFTTRYESAVAFGKCALVTDAEEKRAALVAICEKFTPVGAEKIASVVERTLEKTGICRVTIERVTGKQNEGE
jgi:nitroimidazol reductase NimA-like FMN-containing flavoprotein (pyridoxamine 5'-phosphate oxidase superfamily)